MELKQMIRQAWSKRIYNNSDNAKVQKKSTAYWLGRLNKPRQVCRFTNNKLGTDEVVDPVQGRQKYYGRAMRLIMNIECILQSQM